MQVLHIPKRLMREQDDLPWPPNDLKDLSLLNITLLVYAYEAYYMQCSLSDLLISDLPPGEKTTSCPSGIRTLLCANIVEPYPYRE